MYALKFSTAMDLPHINLWLEHRKLPSVTSGTIPANGIMIMHDTRPMAAGFLRKVEGGYLMLDSVISNPQESPAHRDEALNLVFKRAVELARDLDAKFMIGTSVDAHTLERAKKFGFSASPYALMVLELT